jgi:hypothetical protein
LPRSFRNTKKFKKRVKSKQNQVRHTGFLMDSHPAKKLKTIPKLKFINFEWYRQSYVYQDDTLFDKKVITGSLVNLGLWIEPLAVAVLYPTYSNMSH